MSRTASINDLRSRIPFIGRREHVVFSPPLRLGISAIDQHLPRSGIERGALHEFVGERACMLGFMAALAGRDNQARRIIWIRPEADSRLFVHGLAQLGLTPQRLVIVAARKTEDRLWAFEEAVRDLKNSLAIAEVENASLTETRRLQLAAERSGAIAFLMRNRPEPSAAATRWRIEPAPSDGLNPRWRIALERCRGAMAGAIAGLSWLVDFDHATLSFHLAAALADGSLAAE